MRASASRREYFVLCDMYLFNVALKCDEESLTVIKLALLNDANPNTKLKNGHTIMMELIYLASLSYANDQQKKSCIIKVVHEMLKYGGDINILDENNESALFAATKIKDKELIRLLLDGKIDPNIQNKDGNTAILNLIYDGMPNMQLIAMLIDYGAKLTIPNKENKTIYEILNILELHIFGTCPITDEVLLKKINPAGNYITLINELLKRNKENLNYLDSSGYPIFFKPLLYDHLTLFKLYMKYGLDINKNSRASQSIFFVYVNKVFEENKSDPITCERFQTALTSLLSAKIDQNYQDKLGWTVLHKIMLTPCNEKLFDILTKVVLFDYTIVDNLGRSVMHNAVWGDKPNIVRKIHLINSEIINIYDIYGLLPISYAALLGNQQLVLLFLELGSNIKGGNTISPQAIAKFSPMVKNLIKLKIDLDSTNPISNKIDMVINQIKKDFGL
jgi:ankyrin repeat protein